MNRTLSLFAVSLLFISTVGAAEDHWFLAVGHGGHRMLSRDGNKWELHQEWGKPGHDQNDLNVAVNYRSTFYAAGGYFSGHITATRDGKVWSDGVIPGSSPIFGFEILNDTLYAVDLRGNVFKTTDGESWPLVAKSNMPSKTHWIRASTQGKGLILASGDYGPVLAFDPAKEKITITQMAGQTEKFPGLKRVAFGNGVFVIGGQAGLLASTKDGIAFINNEVKPDRGDIQCVEFVGKEFIATTLKGAFHSADGLDWQPLNRTVPRQIRHVDKWYYGYTGSPTKITRSKDGVDWQAVPNEKEWQGKAYSYGSLSGGTPPKLPMARK